MEEEFLYRKLDERKMQSALRELRLNPGSVDFSSNDYLGMVRNKWIEKELEKSQYATFKQASHGSTGSRLLSGNYKMIAEAEEKIAFFHEAPAGLIFNSGYDANLGLLSSIPQRGDTVIYDQFAHASIRDGIRLSFAQSFSFLHNDLSDLESRLMETKRNVFIVTESVFSMDGDLAPLAGIVELAGKFQARLIVDEAHATGIVGKNGEGLVQQLGLQAKCFARVHTFGKALGCHGAIVLGSDLLKSYLINFCRPFIYTTALPESSIAAILAAYAVFPGMESERLHLKDLVKQFRDNTVMYNRNGAAGGTVDSITAIQGFILPGNENVRKLSKALSEAGLDARPILYPTVSRGTERIRIILHSFNTQEELQTLTSLLCRQKNTAG